MFYKEKFYSLINWKNRPNLSTPLGAKNLNKMDKAIGELDERVVETSKEAEKNKLNVQNLGLEVESISKDIEEVRESTQYIDSSKIVTNKSGAPVYIDDASNMKIENIVFYGESEQLQTTGAQLFDVNDKYDFSTSCVVDSKGWITINYDNSAGTSTAYLNASTKKSSLLATSTNYLSVVEVESISNATIYPTSNNEGVLKGQFETAYTSMTLPTSKGIFCNIVKTRSNFDDAFTMARTIIAVPAGKVGSAKFRLSIIKDTTVTANTFVYEKFTGGKASPNPDYPKPIEPSSVGSVRVYRKNLLNASGLQPQTTAGITFTPVYENGMLQYVNVNGTWDSSNTATNTRYKIGTWYPKTKGNYVLNGMTYLNELSYLCLDKNGGGGAYEVVANTTKEFTVSEDAEYYDVWLRIANGTSVKNLKIYPMIRPSFFTDGTYEPYESQFASLTSSMYFLDGIGDIRDTIEIDANGNGKYIQRIGKIYTKNVSTVYSSSYTNPNGNVFIVAFSSWEKEILWTHRNKGQSVSTLTKDQYYVGQNENSASGKVIYFISDATTTASALAEIKAENSEIYYILLEPIETALSTEEMNDFSAMLKLHTYKPNTIVDAQDTLIDVQYVADLKSYVDGKFRELATVIVNQ